MGLSRNTIVKPVDFNLPGLQIPVEALYGQMQQYQNLYDTTSQLSSLMPKYIDKDIDWANKYKAYTSEITNAVTNAFASRDTGDALRTLRNAQSALAAEWKPGGLAYGLQERHDAYKAGLAHLQKAHEKDPSNLNYLYGIEQFTKHAPDMDYDYTTQKYNAIGQPTVYNYTNIGERLRDEVKAIIPDITENDIINGLWIERLRTKGYDDNRIRGVWQGILNSPEIQQQLAVEHFGKSQNFTEDEKDQMLFAHSDRVRKDVDNKRKTFDALSVEQKQKFLAEQGLYKGKIDGVAGEMTNEAVKEYKEMLKEEAKAPLRQTADEHMLQEFVIKPYEQQFLGYLGKEYSHTLKPNQVALQQQRLQHQRALQDREFMFQQSLLQKETESGLYTPTQALDITQHFNTARKDLNGIVKSAETEVKSLVDMSEFNTSEELAKHLTAFEKSNTYEEYVANVRNTPGYENVDDQALGIYYRNLKQNAATYKEAIVNEANAKESLQRLSQQEAEIYSEVSKPEFEKAYKKYGKGLSYEQFVQDMVKASAMNADELKKHDWSKRFYRDNQTTGATALTYGVPTTQNNIAKELVSGAQTKMEKDIKAGKYTPPTGVRYSLSGLSSKYGGGRISALVQKDMKAGSLYGYEDFVTGNRDKFTDINGEKVKLTDLDPESIHVEYDSGWGKPSYYITAKDANTKKYRTLRVKVPETHKSVVGATLDQEIAIGVNNGDVQSAARAARFKADASGNILDIAGASIKPNNKNTEMDNMIEFRLNDQIGTLELPVTVTYKTPYAAGTHFEIITFNDTDGKQKWATTLIDGNGSRALVGKAEKRDGTIKPKIDHTNLSDMYYNSYSDALDNVALYKAVNEIPLQQVYESIPKDLRGLNLGRTFSTDVVDYNDEN